MNALQLLMLAGMLVAAGVATFVWWASPAEPDLADALDRISPHPATTVASVVLVGDGTERVGLWALRRLPASWVRVPARDLAVLRKSIASFYGDKLAFAGLAALAVPLSTPKRAPSSASPTSWPSSGEARMSASTRKSATWSAQPGSPAPRGRWVPVAAERPRAKTCSSFVPKR